MEEDEYKSTYNKLASVRCVFEKALTNNLARCRLSLHFCLADREGYSCNDKAQSKKCAEFLEILREKSAFALKSHEIKGPLPHNMEIRVQAGGLTGLAKLAGLSVANAAITPPLVEDIHGLLEVTTEKFGAFEALPYSEIIQSVVQFQGRRSRKR